MIARIRPRNPHRAAVLSVLGFIIFVQIAVMASIHLLSLSLGQNGFYPIVLGGDDGKFHYAVAKYMVGSGEVGANFDLFDVSVWPSVMAMYMRMTGSDDIGLLKQMLLLGRLMAIAAALIAAEGLRKGNRQPDNPGVVAWSRIAVLLLVGLYPSGLFYSFGSLYRDALIYGFHFTTVALLLHVITDKRILVKGAFLVISLPFAYSLYEFRQYAAYSVILAIALWFLGYGIRHLFGLGMSPKARSKATWITMAVILSVGGSALWYTRPVQELIFFRDSYFAMEGSNLRISFTGKNPVQAFPLYVYSLLSNVIGPLPWQVRTASNLFNFVLEVPLLSFIGYAIWKRRASLTPECTFLIVQAVVWFSLIAFSNDNLGTASRLRVIGWQCLFVVFAYLLPRAKGFALKTRRRRAIESPA